MFDLDYIHILPRNLYREQNVHKAHMIAHEIRLILESSVADATADHR
jgi:hypothetical protein